QVAWAEVGAVGEDVHHARVAHHERPAVEAASHLRHDVGRDVAANDLDCFSSHGSRFTRYQRTAKPAVIHLLDSTACTTTVWPGSSSPERAIWSRWMSVAAPPV